LGLEAVCYEEVRRFFGLCRRYEEAYRMQNDVKNVSIPALVRLTGHKYKSHRKVSPLAPSKIDEGLCPELVAKLKSKASCTCCDCTDRDAQCGAVFCGKHSRYIKSGKTAQGYYSNLPPKMKKILTAKRSFGITNAEQTEWSDEDDCCSSSSSEEEEEPEEEEEEVVLDEVLDDVFSSEEDVVGVEVVSQVDQQTPKKRRIPRKKCCDKCGKFPSQCKCS
jgi:hypothetical protein